MFWASGCFGGCWPKINLCTEEKPDPTTTGALRKQNLLREASGQSRPPAKLPRTGRFPRPPSVPPPCVTPKKQPVVTSKVVPTRSPASAVKPIFGPIPPQHAGGIPELDLLQLPTTKLNKASRQPKIPSEPFKYAGLSIARQLEYRLQRRCACGRIPNSVGLCERLNAV